MIKEHIFLISLAIIIILSGFVLGLAIDWNLKNGANAIIIIVSALLVLGLVLSTFLNNQ